MTLEALTALAPVISAFAAAASAIAAAVAAGGIVYFGIAMLRDNKDRKAAADKSMQALAASMEALERQGKALERQGKALDLTMQGLASALHEFHDLRRNARPAE